ncbi:hypothetical protein L6R52_38555 [Myxococcota bacterium]|nr:hypothetical protein [Myxococcota bacterium]
MTGIGLHFFTDRVLRIAPAEDGRSRVFFRREIASLWVHPASADLVERLAEAAESGDELLIGWHPGTFEIIDVR